MLTKLFLWISFIFCSLWSMPRSNYHKLEDHHLLPALLIGLPLKSVLERKPLLVSLPELLLHQWPTRLLHSREESFELFFWKPWLASPESKNSLFLCCMLLHPTLSEVVPFPIFSPASAWYVYAFFLSNFKMFNQSPFSQNKKHRKNARFLGVRCPISYRESKKFMLILSGFREVPN